LMEGTLTQATNSPVDPSYFSISWSRVQGAVPPQVVASRARKIMSYPLAFWTCPPFPVVFRFALVVLKRKGKLVSGPFCTWLLWTVLAIR
jgi:hypothetical protein